MDFRTLNSSQLSMWNKFANGLQDLNKSTAKLRFQLWWMERAVTFYKDKTEALPPSFQFDDIQSWTAIAAKWINGVQVLNNAYALTQTGQAVLAESSTIPGDLDIIIEKGTVPDSALTTATYNRSMLPDPPTLDGWIIPVLVVGAILGGIALVKGIVSDITDANVKVKHIDYNIAKARSNVEKDMKDASPEIYKLWSGVKQKELQPAEKGFMANLATGAGGFLGVAAIGLAAFFVLKNWGKK
jgi:hypothetical protein